jgi:hypothetical protein
LYKSIKNCAFFSTSSTSENYITSGLGHDSFEKRFDLVKSQFQERGTHIIEGECLKDNIKCISAPKEKRAKEFIKFCENEYIDLVGTKYGDISSFYEKFAHDEGLILYYELKPHDVYRTLFKMEKHT